MTDPTPAPRTVRARREPPAFRRLEVRRVDHVGPRLVRVTLTGPELGGFSVELPAASVRLLLPSPGTDELVIPTWRGNEFLLPDGRRPALRTFTPRRVDPAVLELDIDVVAHGGGVASDWVARARPGDGAAVSGPGRGYTIDPTAPAYLLAGDESALAAVSQLLEALPATTSVDVHLEVAAPEGRVPLPGHPRASVRWHDLPSGAPPGAALAAAVEGTVLADGTRVWVAGEAAGVQRIRRHLFEARGVPRSHTSIRGYWKAGRSGDADDDDA